MQSYEINFENTGKKPNRKTVRPQGFTLSLFCENETKIEQIVSLFHFSEMKIRCMNRKCLNDSDLFLICFFVQIKFAINVEILSNLPLFLFARKKKNRTFVCKN